MRRVRHQQGSLQRVKRRKGPDVWIFRWWETQIDGTKTRRKAILGTAVKYPTESAAQKATDALRVNINQESSAFGSITVALLVEHYRKKELSPDDHEKKAFSTKEAYEAYLTNWIIPRWGKYRMNEVKAVAVEDWLGQIPRSNGTKAKIRNIMSAIFNHAIRYEWLDRNPITLVRQSAKRERIPDILEVDEIQALLAQLDQRERTLVLLDAVTGVRRGELLALKWEDVDFERLQLSVTRSIYRQVIGSCKTETSRKPVPLDPFIAEELFQWRGVTPYCAPGDWVFASPVKNGTQPYWPEHLLRRHILPAAKRAGISKRIGWHTFRHSYSTLLKGNGEDVKVVQELLRHANSRITLDTYVQALTPAKRAAQSKVVEMILPRTKAAPKPNGPLTDLQVSAEAVSH